MLLVRCKECNKVIAEVEGVCKIRKRCNYCGKYNVAEIKNNQVVKHYIEKSITK